ncbi:RNA polymerase sigma factor FliA [Candidatus Pantoea formicae]|uniref:RNA polymerase sigma factor FliA n=1 Tax=Candidatus Pantoea formicae TaxID=2608355 RepID=UPI003ED94290
MDGLYTDVGLDNKEVLWSKYQSLVRQEVLRLQKRLPASVEFDDLIQAGAIGFISAVDSFDANKGVTISAWITQRVRWALMDELRERDWVPRRVRTHSREIAAIISRVEQEKGSSASEMDIAERMGVSIQTFQQMLADSNNSQIYSIDELQESYDDLWEHPDDEHELLNPVHQSIQKDLVARITEHIGFIPEREQRILQFYYQYDLNMREISLIMNITETRVSQLHSLAIKRLRSRMDCDCPV